jgi:hypothetical protein
LAVYLRETPAARVRAEVGAWCAGAGASPDDLWGGAAALGQDVAPGAVLDAAFDRHFGTLRALDPAEPAALEATLRRLSDASRARDARVVARRVLPDTLWAQVAPLLVPGARVLDARAVDGPVEGFAGGRAAGVPAAGRRGGGRPRLDDRGVLTGAAYLAVRGVPARAWYRWWRRLPRVWGCGSWMTFQRRLHAWRADAERFEGICRACPWLADGAERSGERGLGERGSARRHVLCP